jgi:hypothetical protein
MATLYRTNDNPLEPLTEEEVQPKNGTDFQLDELQDFVGGYIEIIHLNDGRIMVINEEGKLLDLPVNLLATVQYQLSFGPIDQIYGNALVCENKEVL